MERLKCLDGLRGVLAVYVMIGHMAPFAAVPGWIMHPFSHGGAAVDMFFILSGLVIVGSLQKFDHRAAPFLLARLCRIFPVYLVVFAAAVAIQALPHRFEAMTWLAVDSPAPLFWSEGWPASWPIDIAAHLTMLHGLVPDGVLPHVWVSFLGAAWSLSTEWQFYVLALILGRRMRTWREPWVGMAWALVALWLVGVGWDRLAPPDWHFSRAFLGNKAGYFALGVMSALVVQRRPNALRNAVPLYVTVIAVCLMTGGFAKTLPPIAWLLCLGAQMGVAAALLARILCWGAVQRCGAWSYCIYLVNEPVQEVLGLVLASWADGDGFLFTLIWIPVAILLPTAIAAVLHYRIETPARLWGSKWIAHRFDRRPLPVQSEAARLYRL